MKAKGLKKRLMRTRRRVFWGRRAMVTVRLPMSIYPGPIPTFQPPGESNGWEGYWKRREDDVEVLTNISKFSSGAKPEGRAHSKTGLMIEAHFIEEDYPEHWSFWEGVEMVYKIDPATGKRSELVYQRNLPVEIIEAYRARRNWLDACFHGDLSEETFDALHPVLQAFLWAAGGAKTTYHYVSRDKRYVYRTYSVKWFHPNQKRRFCQGLAWAFSVAKQHDVHVKIM